MRPFRAAVVFIFILSIQRAVFAQEWTEFASREDRFTSNFPGQPKVSETVWTSEYGASLPARVYSAEAGPGRYSMTVVDYRDVERILTERSKSCPRALKPAGAAAVGGHGACGVPRSPASFSNPWDGLTSTETASATSSSIFTEPLRLR